MIFWIRRRLRGGPVAGSLYFFLSFFSFFSTLSFGFNPQYSPVWLLSLEGFTHVNSSYALTETMQLENQQIIAVDLASKLGLGVDVDLKNTFNTAFSFYYQLERIADPSEKFSLEESLPILRQEGHIGMTQQVYEKLSLSLSLYGQFSSDYIRKHSLQERFLLFPSVTFSWTNSEISEFFYIFENNFNYADGQFSVKTKRDGNLPRDYSFGFNHLSVFERWNFGFNPYFYFADYLNGQDQMLDYKRKSFGLATFYEYSSWLMFLGKIERTEHLFANEFLFARKQGGYDFLKRHDVISYAECSVLFKVYGSFVSGLSWHYAHVTSPDFLNIEKNSHSFSLFVLFSEFPLSRLRRVKNLDNFLISDLHSLVI